MEIMLKCVIFFLVFVQGGFFEQSYCTATAIMGISLFAVAVKTRGKNFKKIFRQAWGEICLFLSMILLFLISVWYHHTPFQNSGRISYFCLILFLYIALFFVEDFMGIYRFVLFTGVAESMVALLVYGGIKIPGVIVNARFMGTFQYANATALFMGIVLFLQWGISDQKKIFMPARILMFTVLILTFSAGGIACYCAIAIIWQIVICRKKRDFLPLIKSIFEIIVSVAFAVGIYVVRFRIKNMFLVWLLLVCLMLISIHIEKIMTWVEKRNMKIISVLLSVILILEGSMGIWLFGDRIRGTGMERISQMSDGIIVLCQNPLFGLGIHGWERYIEDQSHITYKVSLIHNSFLQLGIEAGIFLVVLLLCLIIKWFHGSFRRRNKVQAWQWAVMVMSVVHFMIDITFFFSGIIVVVMSCIFYENSADNKKSNRMIRRKC